MYLPSKTKFKALSVYFLIALLIFLPFKSTVSSLFSLFFRRITITPKKIYLENQNLRRDNLALKLKLKESEHLVKENRDLKKALDFKNDSGFDLTAVGVLSFSPSIWRRYLLINGGTDIGLKSRLLAIDTNGRLVGKITEVKKTFSHLLLVTDPNFSLPVFVGDSGLGLLKGNLTGAKILYIEEKELVKKGDKIWVKSGSSAPPIEVGEVKNVKKGTNQLFCDVTVKLDSPGAFFDKVFIVR